ncbi:MAG: hypothetical protein DHS20C11_08580 [Lysobacteraceae bacterium]|nr:MAG: hypothetical protein DHS20C11_08580 [Xanthomonadaceae bacterium]
MLFRKFLLILVSSAVLAVSSLSSAQDASDLLDRGVGGDAVRGPMVMTNTISNLMGTPGVTIGAIMTVAPAAPVGVFHGYFFASGVDFPTSYHPFAVTGAYVWGAPPILGSPIVGAGAAPGPFTVATGTWAGFSAMAVPFGPFSPGMIYGSKGLFTSAPSVATGLGVACGFDPAVAGAVLGGLTPGTGGGKPVVAFAAPGTMSSLGPIAAPPATYVAGCFVSGATVPVELQSFNVN